MARALPLFPLLFLLPLLWAGAGSPLEAWGAEVKPPPDRQGGWRAVIKKAIRLSEDLADYPVRHDVFRRCLGTLESVRATLVATDAPPEGASLRALREDLKRGEGELAGAQAQVREVVREFGKGLEISYEGAFSDFSATAGELASLLGQLEEEMRARGGRLSAPP